MENFNDALVFIAMASALFAIIFVIARYTYLIKMEMIRQGIYLKSKSEKLKYLDLGCIVFGLGFGLLVSSIFPAMNLSEDTTDLLVWGTILVFGSGGLILAHFLRSRLED